MPRNILTFVYVSGDEESGQVAPQARQDAGVEAVAHPDAALLGLDDAGLAQDAQVVRDGRLGDRAAGDELVLRQLAGVAQLQDVSSASALSTRASPTSL
jgi:hypothetical protein